MERPGIGALLLKARDIQGGSKGTIIEYPPMALDQDYPNILVHCTHKKALDGMWVDRVYPGETYPARR